MLEATILDQVRSIFQPLEARYTFHITCNPEHEQAGEMIDFLNDIASCSDKLSCQVTETDEPKLEFTLLKEGKETGIKFRAVPGGHEFSSLLLAVLNADGKGKNLPDEGIGRRIKALQGPIHLQTYVSLACTNCPDIVPLRENGHSPSEAFNETVEELTQSLMPLFAKNGMDWMYANCSTTAQRGALDWMTPFHDAIKPVVEKLYHSVKTGNEAQISIDSNSKPDYREKLEEELKALRESEMWQTAVTVRKLRPENN